MQCHVLTACNQPVETSSRHQLHDRAAVPSTHAHNLETVAAGGYNQAHAELDTAHVSLIIDIGSDIEDAAHATPSGWRAIPPDATAVAASKSLSFHSLNHTTQGIALDDTGNVRPVESEARPMTGHSCWLGMSEAICYRLPHPV